MSDASPNLVPEPVAEAFAALSGERALEITRLRGNAPVPTWRVIASTRTVAVRLYPETDGPLPSAHTSRQVALLTFLRSQGFPVPEISLHGCYGGQTVLAQSWLGERVLADALAQSHEDTKVLGEAFGALHASLHRLPTVGLSGLSAVSTPEKSVVALLHLDYHPLNVVVGGDGALGVIDWDNARLGDPRADVARTLSILTINPDLRELPPEARRALRTLRRAYLRGYQKVAGESALVGLPTFLVWAGEFMLEDLAGRYSKEALAPLRHWTAHWAHV